MNPWERKHDAMLHEFAEVIGADAVSLKVRTLGHDASGAEVPANLAARCWGPPDPKAGPGDETWFEVAGERSIKWISHDTGVELLFAATNLEGGCAAALTAIRNLSRELEKPENSAVRELTSDLAIELRLRSDDEVHRHEIAHFPIAGEPPESTELVSAARNHLSAL